MSKKNHGKDKLVVWLKDGGFDTFESDMYTDYYYDGNVFVVIRDKQWIAMYNMDVFGKFRFFD